MWVSSSPISQIRVGGFAKAGVVLVAIMLTIVGSMAAGSNYEDQNLGDHFGTFVIV